MIKLTILDIRSLFSILHDWEVTEPAKLNNVLPVYAAQWCRQHDQFDLVNVSENTAAETLSHFSKHKSTAEPRIDTNFHKAATLSHYVTK